MEIPDPLQSAASLAERYLRVDPPVHHQHPEPHYPETAAVDLTLIIPQQEISQQRPVPRGFPL